MTANKTKQKETRQTVYIIVRKRTEMTDVFMGLAHKTYVTRPKTKYLHQQLARW